MIKMSKQKHQTWSRVSRQKVLGFFPDDCSKIKSTDLLQKARKCHMSPNTFYKRLEELIEIGAVKRIPPNPDNLKEKYYTINANVKLVQISDETIKKYTEPLVKELIEELRKTITLEIDYCNENAPFDNNDEKKAFINEILNEEELKLTLGRILIKQGNILIGSVNRLRS